MTAKSQATRDKEYHAKQKALGLKRVTMYVPAEKEPDFRKRAANACARHIT